VESCVGVGFFLGSIFDFSNFIEVFKQGRFLVAAELCMWMESSNTVYGRSNNPYHQGRIVGGSSGLRFIFKNF
jgi:hypothetical protein